EASCSRQSVDGGAQDVGADARSNVLVTDDLPGEQHGIVVKVEGEPGDGPVRPAGTADRAWSQRVPTQEVFGHLIIELTRFVLEQAWQALVMAGTFERAGTQDGRQPVGIPDHDTADLVWERGQDRVADERMQPEATSGRLH